MNIYGGAKANRQRMGKPEDAPAILPHDYCALTLAPFMTPVVSPTGEIFDLESILPYLEEHKKNPVTSEPLQAHQLIPLRYSRDAAGKFYCPVTEKLFSDHSHIVAVKRDGRVYSMVGLARLSDDGGVNYRDFFTNEPFTSNDLLTLQDPSHPRDIAAFDHVRLASNPEPLDVGEDLKKSSKGAEATQATQTSTIAMDLKSLASKSAATLTNPESIMFQSIKGNELGRATIRTNFGDLNLELFCGRAPRTCYNFLQLAKRGYYAGVAFHRLIPGFALLGGDPTGTGVGGYSCWGPGRPFLTESHPSLPRHTLRGLLAMAHRGTRRSNTSQFLITLAPAPQLDGLHPVFGRVLLHSSSSSSSSTVAAADVAGYGHMAQNKGENSNEEVLQRIEAIPVDEQHRPREGIIIKDVIVVEDPFAEYQRKQEQLAQGSRKRQMDPTLLVKQAKSTSNNTLTIGRYLPSSSLRNNKS